MAGEPPPTVQTQSGDGLDPVAGTARWTAAMRAQESVRPDRLFDDPLAAALAGEPGRALLEQMGDQSTIAITVRTRFFDDAITDITAGPDGLRQVVLLAAGMDTRAYRLDLPAGTTVFELDRPDLLHLKDTLLAGSPAPRCTRRPVGVDLAGDWTTALTSAGFEDKQPTIWLAEGLTPYLEAPAVRALLDWITTLSAPGSHLLIDVVGQSMLDSVPMRPWLDELARRGMPWLYGTDQPEELLQPLGWRTDVTLLSTAGTRLGRWPFPDVPRGTPGVPQGYLIRAHRRSTPSNSGSGGRSGGDDRTMAVAEAQAGQRGEVRGQGADA